MDTTGLLIALGAALAALAIGLVLGWLAARRLKRAPRWLARLGGADPVTEEDLYELVDDADQQDLIDSSQKEMINNIIELADVTAGDIMTHRMDMVAVEEGSTCREVIAAALASGNSRLPLYRKTVDEVVGVLYVKDLLALFDEPDGLESPVRRFCRRAIYVPESRPASQLLLDFKNQHTLLAIVVDEYGGTAGLVSMEDNLEEIVGDIQDEYDDEEAELSPDGDGFLADGALDLEDVFEAFGLECPGRGENEEFDTVGGLIADKLGRIPAQGEAASVSWGGLTFTVVKAGERRIHRVRCTRAQSAAGSKSPERQGHT